MKLHALIPAVFTLTLGLAQAQQSAPDQQPKTEATTDSSAPSAATPVATDSTATGTVAAETGPDSVTPAAADSTAATSAATDSVAAGTSATDSGITESVTGEPAPIDSLAAPPAVADAPREQSQEAVPDSLQGDQPKEILPPQLKLAGGTPLAGNISGFIKADRSPYLVTGNLVVEQGSVLVVEPGVVMQFSPGTGMLVKGQFVVAGTRTNTVTFRSASTAPKNGDWHGIVIASETPVEVRNAVIRDAENGIAIENGTLNVQSSQVENTSRRGIYARNSKLNISESQFYNNGGAALHVANYSEASLENLKFEGNNVALFNDSLGITNVGSSMFHKNACAILDMGNSHLSLDNSQVAENKVGASAGDVLDKDVIESISNNETDYAKDFGSLAKTLPSNPEIPGVSSRAVEPGATVGTLLAQRAQEEERADSTPKAWSIIGNVMIGGKYHYVKTRQNDKKSNVVVAGDTIRPGKHYKNTFQVPGLGAEASAYVMMQSSDGRTIEFHTDLTSDSWNHFSPNPVTLSYTDKYNYLVLGDFNKVGGDIYMSSLPLFGAGYSLSLLKNNANLPLFELDGFFGESRKPYLLDERHPYIYKNYIEDGEAQAQRLAYGASVKWAPLRRFDAKLGFVYADDEIHDPLLRDGGSRSTVTNEPLQQSFSLYADGNWLFYPGDIELKGQIAVGRADTADVYRERAINKVFTDAGLNTSSMSKLRQLMADQSKINSLSAEELDEIFGSNTTLNRPQMRDSLRALIREAKNVQTDYEDDRDDDRVLGLNWGSQNFAVGASLYWNINKTTISGHLKYVGEDYYSAGSADQLSDTREFGGYIEQVVTGFWTIGFGYQIDIENAAKDKKTNILGLGEGTHWGLFADEDDRWFDEHELDNDRTKYIQNWNLDNSFKIGSNMNLKAGYNLEYRTQYRPYQLHGNYILEDGIYRDGWFGARKGKSSTEIVNGSDTTLVDSARWAEYVGLSGEDFLASRFQERIYKNTWNLELSINAFSTTFKLGGRWTIRTDDSKFHRDSLIKDMNLSNETKAKLGYYFGGADYFEHAYPLSATTSIRQIQNIVSVTPRFKNYKRDDMTESEITVNEDFEIPLLQQFLVLGLTGEFRYLTTSWEEDDRDTEEEEIDVLGEASLTVNHTKRLSSQWYVGSAMYYRPDNLSDEYKDIYGGIRVNYAF